MGVPSRNRGVASGWRIMRWHSPSTLGRPLLILSIIVQLHGARVVERPRTLGAAASPQAHRGGTPRERGAARGHPRPRPRDGLRRRPTRSLPVHQPALAARVRPDQRAVRADQVHAAGRVNHGTVEQRRRQRPRARRGGRHGCRDRTKRAGQLFNAFEQGEADGSNSRPASGLGLATSRRLAEAGECFKPPYAASAKSAGRGGLSL